MCSPIEHSLWRKWTKEVKKALAQARGQEQTSWAGRKSCVVSGQVAALSIPSTNIYLWCPCPDIRNEPVLVLEKSVHSPTQSSTMYQPSIARTFGNSSPFLTKLTLTAMAIKIILRSGRTWILVQQNNFKRSCRILSYIHHVLFIYADM